MMIFIIKFQPILKLLILTYLRTIHYLQLFSQIDYSIYYTQIMRWSMCIQDILQFSVIVHSIFFVEKCDHNIELN
jgi:hypothetical protein